MALTIPAIRSRILSVLADELGTYTYTSNAGSSDTSTAFKIERGTYPLGAYQEPKVTGLECVLEPEIASPGYAALLGGDYVCAHQSRITLKQWDTTDTTLTARGLLLEEFGNLFDSPPVRIPRVEALGAPEQMIFTFTLPAVS
jgi:hypothetical protein